MRIVIALMGLLCAGMAGAESLRLLPIQDGDLVVHRLRVDKSAPIGSQERQPLQFAWPLEADQTLQASPPFRADSREFWTRLSAKELAEGYPIDTSSSGALIRVSLAAGQDKAGAALPALQLLRNGRVLTPGAGLRAQANREQLKATGVDFGSSTAVFQLDPQLPAGRILLRADKTEHAVLLHVHEPHSAYRLQLQASQDTGQAGAELRFSARLLDAGGRIDADRIGGLVTAPDGSSHRLDFAADGDGYLARLQLPATALAGPQLWEAHTFVSTALGEQRLLRDAKTSFAVSAASARFNGAAQVNREQGLQLKLAIDAAQAGRYELRASVFGTTEDGRLVPFAQAHSADWLEAGPGTLPLNIERALLAKAGVRAPFELRALELHDQSRLAKLESRAVGLRLPR